MTQGCVCRISNLNILRYTPNYATIMFFVLYNSNIKINSNWILFLYIFQVKSLQLNKKTCIQSKDCYASWNNTISRFVSCTFAPFPVSLRDINQKYSACCALCVAGAGTPSSSSSFLVSLWKFKHNRFRGSPYSLYCVSRIIVDYGEV